MSKEHESVQKFLQHVAAQRDLVTLEEPEQEYFARRYDRREYCKESSKITDAVRLRLGISEHENNCQTSDLDSAVRKALEKYIQAAYPSIKLPLSRGSGRSKLGEEPWRDWYNLLWDEVYPRWLWEQAFHKAKPFTLEVVVPVTRNAKVTFKKTPIPTTRVNQEVDLTFEFPPNPQPPAEVIIFNQGVSTTIYCFCPSEALAPSTKVEEGKVYLPQQEGEQCLSFDTPGAERFLVIGCTNASEILCKWNLEEGEIEASQLKNIGLDLWEGKTSIFKAELQVTGSL